MNFALIVLSTFLWLGACNIAFDNSYDPLNYGKCSKAPVDVNESPPYSGDNTDIWIAEGVGSGSWGDTCGFRYGSGHDFAKSIIKLYGDGYHAAFSQDAYNGVHTADNFAETCASLEDKEGSGENAEIGNQCGYSCGVCVLITGTEGDPNYGTFLVNEIADIGAVNDNGRGLNIHLGNTAPSIRINGGERKDTQFKRVPCPVTGPIYFNYRTWGALAIYFIPWNHRTGIKTAWVKGHSEMDWIAMPRSWTNNFMWEGYGDVNNWQDGPVYGDDPNQLFDIKLVDHLNREVVCAAMGGLDYSSGAEGTFQCTDASGNDVQFSEPACINTDACDFTDDQVANECTGDDGPDDDGRNGGTEDLDDAESSGTTLKSVGVVCIIVVLIIF